MDSRKIPLTYNFVPQLNELIISYLPPGNIEKLLESETTDINDQIYILGAARKYTDTYQPQILLGNLIELLTKMPNSNFQGKDYYLDEDKNENDTYTILCKKFETTFDNYLRNLFKTDNTLPKKELPVVHDCIMHYCYQYPENAGKIVNANVKLKWTDDWYLIELLLENGADLDAKESKDSLHSLDQAILSNQPVSNILTIIQYLSTYPSSLIDKSLQSYSKVQYSTLVIAGLFSDLSIVNHLVRKFPDKVEVAIKSLNDLLGAFSPLSDYKSIQIADGRTFGFTQNKVKQAIGKLAISFSATHAHLIDDNCKKYGFECLKGIVQEAEDIDECIDIYEFYITKTLINQPDYSILDNVNPFRFFSSNNIYPILKKQFIELVQEKILKIVKSNDYTTQFYNSILDYQKSCLEIFDGAIFSEEHHKKGVDNKYKKLLEERINQAPTSFVSKI